MSPIIKITSTIIAFCAGAIAIVFAITWFGIFMYRTFGPQQEAARRSVFEESKAYNDGMVQELQNMQFQYIQAKPEHREALASVIRHRAAGYPQDRLPADLRSFISSLSTTPVTPEAFK